MSILDSDGCMDLLLQVFNSVTEKDLNLLLWILITKKIVKEAHQFWATEEQKKRPEKWQPASASVLYRQLKEAQNENAPNDFWRKIYIHSGRRIELVLMLALVLNALKSKDWLMGGTLEEQLKLWSTVQIKVLLGILKTISIPSGKILAWCTWNNGARQQETPAVRVGNKNEDDKATRDDEGEGERGL
jgi:hypothetical protein